MTLLVRRDRVSEICQSPGLSDFDLAGPTDASYMAFEDADLDGDFTTYCARHRSSGQWETGIGLYDQATNTLARVSGFRNSNGLQAKINFSVGIVDVWVDGTADKVVMLDADSGDLHLDEDLFVGADLTVGDDLTVGGDLSVTGPATIASTLGLGGDLTITKASGNTVAVVLTQTGVSSWRARNIATSGVFTLSDAAGTYVTVTPVTGAVALTGALAVTGVSTLTGGTAATLTFGTYLTGTSYNSSGNVTLATNATAANTVSTLVARDGSGNFSAGTITASITGSISGNAATATALQNSRTIWGQSFDGTANVTGAISAATTIAASGDLTITKASASTPAVVLVQTSVATWTLQNTATTGQFRIAQGAGTSLSLDLTTHAAVLSGALAIAGALTGATTGAFSSTVSMTGLTATTGTFSGNIGVNGAGSGVFPFYVKTATNQNFFVRAVATKVQIGSFTDVFADALLELLGSTISFIGAVTMSSSLAISGALSGVTTITTSGAINGQTISAAALFTGSVSVVGEMAAGAVVSTLAIVSTVDQNGAYMSYSSGDGAAVFGVKATGANNRNIQIRALAAGVATTVLTMVGATLSSTFAGLVVSAVVNGVGFDANSAGVSKAGYRWSTNSVTRWEVVTPSASAAMSWQASGTTEVMSLSTAGALTTASHVIVSVANGITGSLRLTQAGLQTWYVENVATTNLFRIGSDTGSFITMDATTGALTVGNAATFSSSVTALRLIATGALAAGAYQMQVVASSGAARDVFQAAVSGVTNGFTVQYDGVSMNYTFANVGSSTFTVGAVATFSSTLGMSTNATYFTGKTSGGSTIGLFGVTADANNFFRFRAAVDLGGFQWTDQAITEAWMALNGVDGLTVNRTLTQTRASGTAVDHVLNQNGVSSWTLRNIATTGMFTIQQGGTDWLTIAITTGATVLNGAVTMASTLNVSSTITGTNHFAGAGNSFAWTGRSQFTSSANGVITAYNAAQSDFTRFNLGGETASFPAFKRVATAVHARLADDSDYAPFAAKSYNVNGTAGATGTSTPATGTVTVVSGIVTAIT